VLIMLLDGSLWIKYLTQIMLYQHKPHIKMSRLKNIHPVTSHL
jgi:hypothetical protein